MYNIKSAEEFLNVKQEWMNVAINPIFKATGLNKAKTRSKRQ